MRIFLLFIYFFFLFTSLSAQWRANNWLFGDGKAAGYPSLSIDFRDDSLRIWELPVPPKDFRLHEANAQICTEEGDLEFYINGIDLYNGNHELVGNGELFPSDPGFHQISRINQGVLLLPMPNHEDSTVLLLTDFLAFQLDSGLVGGGRNLTYSIIDKKKNGGQGKVVERKKNLILFDTISFGQITATRHANGRDWWVLVSKLQKNEWFRFLLTPEGFETYPNQILNTELNTSAGQAYFSPDGMWYAKYNYFGLPERATLDIFKFDRCTGELSNHIHHQLSDRTKPGGLSFSSDSRFLYTSVWDSIYQFDLQASDILASKETVAVYDGFTYDLVPDTSITFIVPTRFYMMGLAPDNRIYINVPNVNSNYLHVIDNPNEKGMACNVIQRKIRLDKAYAYTMPNVANYNLGPLIGSTCDTIATVSTKAKAIKKVNFSLYPNPSTGTVSLESDVDIGKGLVCVFYNQMGIEVQRTTIFSKKQSISLWDLPVGLYFYEIWDGNGKVLFFGKIIKAP